VTLDSLVPQDHKAPLDRPEIKEFLAPLEIKVLLDQQVPWAQQVQQVQLEHLVKLDLPDH
jgi:hypothetical protein